MLSKSIPCAPSEFLALLATLPQEGCVLSNELKQSEPYFESGTVTNGGTVMSYSYDGITLIVIGVSKTAWIPTWNQIFAMLETHLTSPT